MLSLLVVGISVGCQSSQVVEQASTEQVRAVAQSAAQDVQSTLSNTFTFILTLAQSLQVSKELASPPSRDQLDAALKSQLGKQEKGLALYSAWEPDALDGQDAANVGKGPQNDATGRFVSYWNRAARPIAVEPLVDYEKPGANASPDAPKKRR